MGIRGLSSYATSLGSQLFQHQTIQQGSSEQPEIFIVDGNAFLYRISKLHVDWSRGGEGATLARIVNAYLIAFKNIGIHPVFIWDGPFDMAKLATVTARTQNSIRSQISYMRAGPSLRANRSFRSEVSTLPLGALKTVQYALESQNIEQIYAAGEADPLIAEVAIKRNAYIVSQDSDFLITNHGSKGYIPLDSLVLSYQEAPEPPSSSTQADESDWTPVKKGRASRPSTPVSGRSDDTSSGDINTSERIKSSTQATFKLYTSTALALHLKIRVSMLPLVAVLLGNDHNAPLIYKSAAGATNGVSVAASRIDSICQALRKHWPVYEKKQDIHSLTDYLFKIINEVRDFLVSEREMLNMAERCVASLSQYITPALPSLVPISIEASESALHVFVPTEASDSEADSLIKTRFLNAYETGKLSRETLQVLCSGIYMRQACLEDPDQQSCTISCGREIRRWVWALLHSSIGIYQVERHKLLEVEVSSDGEEEEEEAAAQMEPEQPSAPIVIEYVRRSATLSTEELEIADISSLLPPELASSVPVLARSTSDRFQVFLHATFSLIDSLKQLTGPHIPFIGVICAIRYLAIALQDSKTQAWTAQIRLAALATAFLVLKGRNPRIEEQELPTDASIQRSAQIVSAFNAIRLLSEALLLTSVVEAPERLFEGSLFHHLLEIDRKGVQALLEVEKIPWQDFEDCLALLEQGLPKEAESVQKSMDRSKRKKTRDQLQKSAGNMAAFASFGNASKPKNPFEMLAI